MSDNEEMMPKLVMHKFIMNGSVDIAIYKTPLFFDIIAIGSKSVLKVVKNRFMSDGNIMVDNRISKEPVLVLDTFSDFEDVKEVYHQIEDILFG